jgi:hypothetical protein
MGCQCGAAPSACPTYLAGYNRWAGGAPVYHAYCPTPVAAPLAAPAVALATGVQTACVIDTAGRVQCWGASLTGGAQSCTPLPVL